MEAEYSRALCFVAPERRLYAADGAADEVRRVLSSNAAAPLPYGNRKARGPQRDLGCPPFASSNDARFLRKSARRTPSRGAARKAQLEPSRCCCSATSCGCCTQQTAPWTAPRKGARRVLSFNARSYFAYALRKRAGP